MNRKTLKLPPAFIAYARAFSVVPVELAERVLVMVSKQRNRKFTVLREDRRRAA